jgi:hypothetical protein
VRYLLILLLSGCTSFNALQSQVATQGAAAADEVRETAEFSLCRGITVGAWLRAYGSSKERAEAWRVLCSPKVEATP